MALSRLSSSAARRTVSTGPTGDLAPLYVSVSNLDAVDFVALAVLSHATRQSCNAFIDSSTTEHRPGTEQFDPRGAVPLPVFGRGPDGLVKQLVCPLWSDDVTGRVDLTALRADEVAGDAVERVAAHLHGHSAQSFVQAAFDRLAPGVRVHRRDSRALHGDRLRSLLGIIEEQLSHLQDSTPDEPRVFTQGGYLENASSGQRYERWSRDATGNLNLHSDGHTSLLSELPTQGSFAARGPLDAATWCTEGSVLCGHLPWFLESQSSPGRQQPQALEVLQSLFLRSRAGNDLRDLSSSGVLLDEFPDAGLDDYQQMVGAQDWVYATVRWMAEHHPTSRERWAWSQAAARKLTEELRRSRVPDPPPSLFEDTVFMARRVDASVANAFSGREPTDPTNDMVSATAAQIDHAAQRWSECHRRWLLPPDFGQESDVALDGMTSRVSSLIRNAPTSAKALAGLRSLAWRVVENGTRTLMIVGDTHLRASLPTLALFAEGPAVARFVEQNRDAIAARVGGPHLMVIT